MKNNIRTLLTVAFDVDTTLEMLRATNKIDGWYDYLDYVENNTDNLVKFFGDDTKKFANALIDGEYNSEDSYVRLTSDGYLDSIDGWDLEAALIDEQLEIIARYVVYYLDDDPVGFIKDVRSEKYGKDALLAFEGLVEEMKKVEWFFCEKW